MPRAEESYRLWCVIVCDLETSRMRRFWPALGCCDGERGERGNVSYLIALLSHYCHISDLYHIVGCFLYPLLTNATSSDISHCVTTVPTSWLRTNSSGAIAISVTFLATKLFAMQVYFSAYTPIMTVRFDTWWCAPVTDYCSTSYRHTYLKTVGRIAAEKSRKLPFIKMKCLNETSAHWSGLQQVT